MVSPGPTDMPPPSRQSQPPGNPAASVKNENIASPQLELSDDEDSTSQLQDAESPSEDAPSLAPTQSQTGTGESAGDVPVVPIQKRRRVTRVSSPPCYNILIYPEAVCARILRFQISLTLSCVASRLALLPSGAIPPGRLLRARVWCAHVIGL